MLAKKTIIGFNLGDEMSWACLPPTELSTVAAELCSHFPRGSAIIWYNEASGPLDPTSRWRVPMPWGKADCLEIRDDCLIPAALDWFSVDIRFYHSLSDDSKWITSAVRSFYEKIIFTHLSPEQRVVLIPGNFGCNKSKSTCNATAYDAQSSRDASDFIAWARADMRVFGVFPWHWTTCPMCDFDQSGGTRDMSVTRAAWERFGLSVARPWYTRLPGTLHMLEVLQYT